MMPTALFLLFLPAPALAQDAASVQKLTAQGNHKGAQTRCEKWDAIRSSDGALREACAEAYWPTAKENNSVEYWKWYREAWKDTPKALVALELEAQRAFDMIAGQATEAQYAQIAKDYPNTGPAREAMSRAADIAYREVDGADSARAFVRRYPTSRWIPELVQNNVTAIARVEFAGEGFTLKLDEAVPIPSTLRTQANWVARDASGRLTAWDLDAKQRLVAAGLPEAFVAQAARMGSDDQLKYPICHDPRGAPDTQVGVMVSIGRGSTFFPGPWGDGCGPDAPPVLLTVTGNRVTGLSLRPGHALTFPSLVGPDRALAWGPPLQPVRLLLPRDPEAPILDGATARQPMGPGLSLVHPLDGGMPWLLVGTAPESARALPLSGAILGAPLPADVQKVQVGGAFKLMGKGYGQGWELPPGEPRALSGLMQQVMGLTSASHAALKAPVLPGGGWTLAAAAPEVVLGPYGSAPVLLEETDPEGAVDALVRAGIAITAFRAWRGQLDGDADPELIVEGAVDGLGVRLILDRVDAGTRVFALHVGDGALLQAATARPFAFAYEGRMWAAWVNAGNPRVEAFHLHPAGLFRDTSGG